MIASLITQITLPGSEPRGWGPQISLPPSKKLAGYVPASCSVAYADMVNALDDNYDI